MPSGSHGGSPGIHSSGGARSSGGRSSGGFSSSNRSSGSSSRVSSYGGPNRTHGYGGFGHFGPRRPFRMHFGTRVYVFGSKVALFIPFIFILLIFIISSSTMVSSNKSYINDIKVDYIYYHQMIQNAEVNTEYLKEGEITDICYESTAQKWYYFYEIDYGFIEPLEGYTYAVYTLEEIGKYKVGDKILIAVNNSNVNANTDSIPVDFKNFDYKDDGEYIVVKSELNKWTAIEVVCWIVEIALVAGMITYMVKTKKREDLEAQETKDREEEKQELEKKTLEKDLDWRCDYCGNLNKANNTKCDNCGAGKR